MRLMDEEGEELDLEDGLELEEAREFLLWLGRPGQAFFEGRELIMVQPGVFLFPTGHRVGKGELLIESGGEQHRLRLQLVSRAEKLPVELWEKLLVDLEAWLPGVVLGQEAIRSGTVGELGVAAPFLLEALLPLLPELIQAIQAFLRFPPKAPRASEVSLPLYQLRKADIQVAAALARPPPPQSLVLEQSRDQLDHPVSRRVAAQLKKVIARLLEVIKQLKGAEGVGAVRAAQAQGYTHELIQLLQGSFLGRLPEPVAVEGCDPASARILRLCARLLSPRFQLEKGPYPARLRSSFQLYELWCLLAVQRALSVVLPGLEWEWENAGALSGEEGAVICRGGELEILYNPVFPGWFERGESRCWSVSAARRPDLVVVGPKGWVVLDAKYRAGRLNLGHALVSAHLYKDALKWERQGPVASVLLAPSKAGEVRDWFDREFLEKFGVGIWEMRPGGGEGLGVWLVEKLCS